MMWVCLEILCKVYTVDVFNVLNWRENMCMCAFCTCATDAEPIGFLSNSSKSKSTGIPSSCSKTWIIVEYGVVGAASQSVTNFLTQASGAKSGLPITCATLVVKNKFLRFHSPGFLIGKIQYFRNRNEPSKRSLQVQNISHILFQLPIHAGFPILYFACPCVKIEYALGKSEMK